MRTALRLGRRKRQPVVERIKGLAFLCAHSAFFAVKTYTAKGAKNSQRSAKKVSTSLPQATQMLPGASESDDCRINREVTGRYVSEPPISANCKKSCLPGYSVKSEPEAVATGSEHSIIEDLTRPAWSFIQRPQRHFSDEAFIFS